MKTVIELAQSVGAARYTNRHYPDRPVYTFSIDQLERLVELVRADAISDERAACLAIADDCADSDMHASMAANFIRARSNT